jgi:hypothetical protein
VVAWEVRARLTLYRWLAHAHSTIMAEGPPNEQFQHSVYPGVTGRLRLMRSGSDVQAFRGWRVDEGESASSKARELREQAAVAMAESGRLAQEAAAWEAGAEGERRVAEALSGLADGPNVLVLHDRLLRWYHDGGDVQARLPLLSTYLGHINPASTYWYLSAVPELMALAAQRLELAAGAIR